MRTIFLQAMLQKPSHHTHQPPPRKNIVGMEWLFFTLCNLCEFWRIIFPTFHNSTHTYFILTEKGCEVRACILSMYNFYVVFSEQCTWFSKRVFCWESTRFTHTYTPISKSPCQFHRHTASTAWCQTLRQHQWCFGDNVLKYIKQLHLTHSIRTTMNLELGMISMNHTTVNEMQQRQQRKYISPRTGNNIKGSFD